MTAILQPPYNPPGHFSRFGEAYFVGVLFLILQLAIGFQTQSVSLMGKVLTALDWWHLWSAVLVSALPTMLAFMNSSVARGRAAGGQFDMITGPGPLGAGRALVAAAVFTACLGLAGCSLFSTPTQRIAMANAEAGNAYATYVLGKQGTPALKGLQDLANALPNIPLGKVSPNQLGVINAELQQTQSAITGSATSSSTSQLYAQVGSLISLVSQSAAAAGGNATAEAGVLVAQALDVQNGINNAIQFWQGQQSVLAPKASP